MAVTVILGLLVALAAFVLVAEWGKAPASADPMDVRLAQYDDQLDYASLEQYEMSQSLRDRVIRPIFVSLGSRLAKRTPSQSLLLVQQRLNMAGKPHGLTVGSFLALRLVATVGLLLLTFAVVLATKSQPPMAILIPLGGLVLGWLMPNSMLSRRIKARKKEITKALPSALDLLTIAVEAGLSFDQALRRVADKYTNALAAEFNQALVEVRLGRPRVEALDDMARRNQVPDLNNFVQAIIQSEQLGVGIGKVLRTQSEEMRRKRRQRAEEAGQKAPIKMLIPMVGCIFPTLFIVLLGPAVLNVAKQFGGH